MKLLDHPKQWSRVLVFAIHPDDESLAAGGLLQKAAAAGAEVRVVFVTDGDNNPWPQRFVERRLRIGQRERARWGARRRDEALAAIRKLGLPPACAHFLGYQDGGITRLVLDGDDTPVHRIAAEISAFHPRLLVTASSCDGHSDHNAFAVLTRLAIDRLAPDERDLTEIQYVIHRSRRHTALPGGPQLKLTPAERACKAAAIQCHTSQMQLSRRRFLAYARDTEPFFEPAPPGTRDARHPVRDAIIEDGRLVLRIAHPAYGRPLLNGRLHLAFATPDGRIRCTTLKLPSLPGPVILRDSATGKKLATCHRKGLRRRFNIAIPRDALPPATRLFAKIEFTGTFLDIAGWREFPLPA